MATEFKHNYRPLGTLALGKRVREIIAKREEVNVDEAHVKFSTGNRKTGAKVPSVSLIPIADCGNCALCARGCYAIRNLGYLPNVQASWANNSAIYRKDPLRYFKEISEYIVKNKVKWFRFHVSGDIVDKLYMICIDLVADANPQCQILVFTKMYDLVNAYIDEFGPLPSNLHIIFSDWVGAKFDNPHCLPISSPVWPDGTKGPHCTERQFMCSGFCEDCAETHTGCWAAKSGETILFEAH